MTHKLESFPQDRRAEVLRLNEQLLEKKIEAVALQRKLHRALIQEWCKMDELVFDSAGYLSFLKAYHRAVENKQDTFTWADNGVLFDTGYAKYLLEYLEGHMSMPEATKLRARQLKRAHEAKTNSL